MDSLPDSKSVSKAVDGLMKKVRGMKEPCASSHQDQLEAFANGVAL